MIEEAESYKKLMSDLNITQQQVAQRLGKSRPYIANMLRLLHLPSEIMTMVREGELSGAQPYPLIIKRRFEDEEDREASHPGVLECKTTRAICKYQNDTVQPESKQSKNKKPNLFNNKKDNSKNDMVLELIFLHLSMLVKSLLSLNQKKNLKD